VTESCGLRGRKFNTVVYSPAIDSIAGDVLPLSWFQNFLINLYQKTKDSGWCLPAIESIARVHIAKFCSPAIAFIIFMISYVFSRYRSIAGKHTKNHPLKAFIYSLKFSRIFVIIVFWQIFSWLLYSPPFPYIIKYKQHVMRIFSSFRRELT
jgi:hypothetical protein